MDGLYSYSITFASEKGDREENQDYLDCSLDVYNQKNASEAITINTSSEDFTHYYVVCDGLGGEVYGDQASRNACVSMKQYWENCTDKDNKCLDELAYELAETAQKAVLDFQTELVKDSNKFEIDSCFRTGTTISLVVIRQHSYVMLNIGDSPVFIYNSDENSLSELSIRHNLASYKSLTNQPVYEGDESQLLFCLGIDNVPFYKMVNIKYGTLLNNDKLILCTDGITNEITLEQLLDDVNSNLTSQEIAYEASNHMGADNCTMIIVSHNNVNNDAGER